MFGQYFAAQQFLTRLPCPSWTPWQPEDLARSMAWFPTVGVVVGGLAAATAALTGGALKLSGAIVAVFVVVVPVMVTGFFHEDAWADVCDAFGGMTPARRREIMRDSRVGSFGATGVALLVIAKMVGLAVLPWQIAGPVVLCAHTLSRWSSVVMISMSSYVDDPSSLSKPYIGQVTRPRLAFATLVPTVPLAIWVFGPVAGAVTVASVIALVWLATRFFAGWLGGITGDCLGAINQLVEVGVYLLAGQPTVLEALRRF